MAHGELPFTGPATTTTRTGTVFTSQAETRTAGGGTIDDHTTGAILAALFVNAGISVAKFVGFALTGSGLMLAEAFHSVADSFNQGFLLLGQRAARRGDNRHAWSLTAAVVIFGLAVAALLDGLHKVSHPEPFGAPAVLFGGSAFFTALELVSFRAAFWAMREPGGLRGHPELMVVKIEDSAALVGPAIAFGAITAPSRPLGTSSLLGALGGRPRVP